MKKLFNKWEIVRYIQAHYESGWEDLAGYRPKEKLTEDLKEYHFSEPNTQFRIIRRKELTPEYEEKVYNEQA